MHSSRLLLAAAAAVAVMSFTPAPAGAQSQTNQAQPKSWISSWTASPQVPRGVLPASFTNRTIRQIVHLSLGGDKVRIRLSNEFGTRPVLIGAASVAVAGQGSGIAAQSLRPLTFGGAKSFVLPPGAPVVSDAVEPGCRRIHRPRREPLSAGDHGAGHGARDRPADGLRVLRRGFYHHVRISRRRPVRQPFLPLRRRRSSRWRRRARSSPSAISITDGTASTVNANRRWPDVLARRLKDAGASRSRC